jgi:hypothetical protein
MAKTAEGAFKKEKCQGLLIQSSKMSKKKDKKNKGVVSKANKPTGGIMKDKGTCHHYGKETLEEKLQGIPCNRECKKA